MAPAVSAPPTAAAAQFAALCVCAQCGGELVPDNSKLTCVDCGTVYPIVNGVLHLLPTYSDEQRQRYVLNYEEIARADLETPFEENRDARHATLLNFIGDVRGKRVLDIGSSDGGYLRKLDTALSVAVDVAAPYLEAIPEETGIVRICTDAETLPFRPNSFDVVVISDVMEHLLDPARLVDKLTTLVTSDTRVIVHVPWEENISPYQESKYEFTHLRSFSYYTFASIWHDYRIARERSTYPALEEPFVFPLRRYLPLRLYALATWAYFHRGYGAKEYQRRSRWIRELPDRERWLVRLYRPLFKIFELRLLERRAPPGTGYAAPLPRSILRAIRIFRSTRPFHK
jgi:SAM-dependent methyltransferase